MQLLVVDDDAPYRALLLRRFQGLGFAAAGAGTCAEAKAKVQQQIPHTMLLDLHLPDGDGLELGRELLLAPETQSIVILAVSSDYDLQRPSLEAGFKSFFPKPTDFWTLVSAVSQTGLAPQVQRPVRP